MILLSALVGSLMTFLTMTVVRGRTEDPQVAKRLDSPAAQASR